MGMMGKRALGTTTRSKVIVPIPDHWSMEDAATVMVTYGIVLEILFYVSISYFEFSQNNRRITNSKEFRRQTRSNHPNTLWNWWSWSSSHQLVPLLRSHSIYYCWNCRKARFLKKALPTNPRRPYRKF